ncbi:MAG: hypothetical protein J1D88_06390 [Treponema sp.]|nr:hypothetical protein [Treponema sp.]
MRPRHAAVSALCAVCFSLSIWAQQNLEDTSRTTARRSAASGFAEEEFRRGVQSYYRGAYNESIGEFEKALSYLPGENLILDWLGKAYYRSGIEGSAIQQWQFASNAGYGGVLLENRIEIISDRRLTAEDYSFSQRYTEAGSFPRMNGDVLVYSQPVSALPNDDGTIWVLAYGTNELLRYDVNGTVIRRIRGPLNGFDRPMDIIRLNDGMLLVSETSGDRLSLLDAEGSFVKNIGSKGRGEGQFVGPQYLATDSFGNIYVTDFGNARVVVFDSEGTPLLHFGERNGLFPGFKSPTGIAVHEDRVFVADSISGAIFEFDRSGNYRGLLVAEKTFVRPESMKAWGGSLLVTDRNRVVAVDVSTGSTYETATVGRAMAGITSAVPDKNGNVIVTDFKANEIYVMAKMTELVGGFFVEIERVIADAFPSVVLEVRVENRHRQQVVGLRQENFFVTEAKRPVADCVLSGAANNNDVADLVLLIDRNSDTKPLSAAIESAVHEIALSMNGKGRVSVISAGAVPVTEFTGSPEALSDFSVQALKSPYADSPALDLGVRLAANELINGEKKRGVIFITAGTVGQRAFTSYGLSDVSAYLNNNSISFSTVVLDQRQPAQEISYITQNTNGSAYYVYRPEGLGTVVSDIIALPSGLYQLRYTSALSTEYGRKYLPVEVETYLLNRSGRDETGYFAPLQ